MRLTFTDGSEHVIPEQKLVMLRTELAQLLEGEIAAAVAEQKRVDAGILRQYIDEANVIDNPETGVKGVLFSLKCLQLVWLLKKIKGEIEGQL